MDWKNRRYCGDLSLKDTRSTVSLYGWVDTIRDHGHLLFIHLRDRSGFVQVVFDPDHQLYETASKLRSEYVIALNGEVKERSAEAKNPKIKTGDIEVVATQLTVLSTAETPPFLVTEKALEDGDAQSAAVDEDIRLQYRYLDLRRPSIQRNLIQRHRLAQMIRSHLNERGFIDVETPVLTKSTPEGARDYLVPSRTHAHHFYALPQSPQLFKQLLMISGLERYYQITKCFRDEDLRPNRQPEFTQVDLEASFIDEEFIYELLESLMIKLYASQGVTLQPNFPRISYDEAMNLYGNDRPDLRFGMTMVDVTDTFDKNTGYKIFNTIINAGGKIKGINLKGQADALSKSTLQEELAKKVIQKLGGKGLTWMKMEGGALQSNIVQFFNDDEQTRLKEALKAEDNDVLFLVADTNPKLVNDVLGRFRLYIAERQNIIDKNKVCPCWVTAFPLFEESDGQLTSVHHPFTQPSGPLPDKSDRQALLALKSRAYDLVINGEEVGGGSIRIHDSRMQQQIFDILGLSESDIQVKFGFFVNALKYGTPPHGGLALGLDRLTSMILGTDSIREVIAFPKNRVAHCPLTEAPSEVAPFQLDDLNIALKPLPKE